MKITRSEQKYDQNKEKSTKNFNYNRNETKQQLKINRLTLKSTKTKQQC